MISFRFFSKNCKKVKTVLFWLDQLCWHGSESAAKIQTTKNQKWNIFRKYTKTTKTLNEKVRETLFTSKVLSAGILSFWRHFSEKIENWIIEWGFENFWKCCVICKQKSARMTEVASFSKKVWSTIEIERNHVKRVQISSLLWK